MPNLGAAFKGAAEGWALGQKIGASQKSKEELYLEMLKIKVAEKQLDLQNQQEQNGKKKMAMDVLNLVIGQDGIDPNRKDAIQNNMKEQFGLDISPYFIPNKDEKTGVVKTYSLQDKESLAKQAQQDIDRINAEAAKTNAAAAKINAETAKVKAERGDFKDIISWYLSGGKRTEDEAIDFMKRVEGAKNAGVGFDIQFTPDGKGIKSITYGGKNQKLEFGDKWTPQNRSELEKSFANLTEQMFGLKNIADTQFSQTLTWPGQIKTVTLKALDKLKTEDLSKEQQDWLGKAWVFKSELGRFEDAYRMEITKSQAGMKELDRLRERVLNSDMSKSQFKYAINYLKDRITRQIRLKRYLLDNGSYQNENEFWNDFDKLVISDNDPTLTPIERTKRGDYIKDLYTKQHKDYKQEDMEKFVVDQLRKEGYLN